MGFREQWGTTATASANSGCRVARWLDNFDGDDRDFLVETLESDVSTLQFVEWIRRQGLERVSDNNLNVHRTGRCSCPPDSPGMRR